MASGAVVVTGAAGLIGFAVATRLAGAGRAVIAAAVRCALPEARIEFGEGADAQDQSHGRFDISAAARVLGWQPQIAFADGVRDYARWLAEHPV